MFWGLIMEPKRRYFQEVTRPFHISMASMDLGACTKEPVQLMVQFQSRNYLLCTLQESGPHQVHLDLNFEAGDEVSFTINGQSHVHLSGYHLEDEADEDDDGEEQSESDNEEEVKVKQPKLKAENKEEAVEEADLSMSNIVYGKRKQSKTSTSNVTPRGSTGLSDMIGNNWESLLGGPVAKRSKTLELLADAVNDESDDDDEDVTFSDLDVEEDSDEGDSTLDVDIEGLESDSDEEDDDLDVTEGDDEEDEDAEEEGEEDEQEDEEADSEEEMEKQLVQKKQTKKEKQQQKQAQQPTPEKQQKKQQNKKVDQPQQQPQMNGTSPSEKKKKRKNKNKQEQNESLSNDLNVSKAGNNQKSPKSAKKPQNLQQQKTFVDRGVTIEEITVGKGNPAKNGKLAHVFYEGRLKNNKKAFDHCLKGRPPFKFRVGGNEVIKGWDIGVVGMKIGGKRRITVPGHLGYGPKGNKPAIPPNATLVFDIELTNVT